MVLTPGQNPLPGIGFEPGGDSVEVGVGEGGGMDVDRDIRSGGEVAEVGEQTVGDIGEGVGDVDTEHVDHLGVGRLRNPMRRKRTREPRIGKLCPAGQYGQPGRRPAELARHRDDVALDRTGAGDRALAPEITEGRHRDHQLIAVHQVPARDGTARARRLDPQTVGDALDDPDRGVGRTTERHDETGGTRPHRHHVGGVLRDGLATDIGRRRPVEPEMPALDEHVGTHHEPSVGRGEQRGVVAGTEQHLRALLTTGVDPVDHGEFTQLTHRPRPAVLADDRLLPAVLPTDEIATTVPFRRRSGTTDGARRRRRGKDHAAMAESSDPTADDRDEATAPEDTAEPSALRETSPGTESAADSQYSPALIATAVALPIVLIVGVLVAAFLILRAPIEREPLALGSVPAPAAEGPACAALMPALPADLGDYTKSTLREPAPLATRAWQLPEGGEPIVLRCGLDRPLEFNRASPLQEVDGVTWFQIRDDAAAVGTWFAVDRETYIALTIPDGSGTAAVQTVSDTIAATLPPQPIKPGEL